MNGKPHLDSLIFRTYCNLSVPRRQREKYKWSNGKMSYIGREKRGQFGGETRAFYTA